MRVIREYRLLSPKKDGKCRLKCDGHYAIRDGCRLGLSDVLAVGACRPGKDCPAKNGRLIVKLVVFDDSDDEYRGG